MSKPTLHEALKLGSDTKRESSDLGRFGMGLVTASISMARKITVITKYNSQYVVGVLDLDVVSKGDWICHSREANEEEIGYLQKFIGLSKNGTAVILEKIDNLKNKNINSFVDTLSEKMGQIFRYFIQRGINISINNKEVDAVDPIASDISENVYSTKLYIDGHMINIRLNKIPLNHDVNPKVNMRNQGFYIIRNQREIASGQDLGIFQKHNDYNRMRGEIHFNTELDESMGVNFQKSGIRPNQAIVDKFREVFGIKIKQLRKILLEETNINRNNDIDNDSSKKKINERSADLLQPPGAKEVRNSPREPSKDRSSSSSQGRPRNPLKKKPSIADKVDFRYFSLGLDGVYAQFDTENKKTIITFNIDHPFYEEVHLKNKDNKKLTEALNFLAYSLGTSYLLCFNDENSSILDNYINYFSKNLKELIKP